MARADPFARLQAVVGPGAGSSDFDLHPDLKPNRVNLRPAAVLLAFEQSPGGIRLYLTKRASGLKHHPGQIAFPGGKIDPSDKDAAAAALREAEEEIGLARNNVEILGALPSHQTVTGFSVTPIVGRVRKSFSPICERGEVEEVFTVPFSHVADLDQFIIEGRYFRGQRRLFYIIPYGPYYIWGATARMLKTLAERLNA